MDLQRHEAGLRRALPRSGAASHVCKYRRRFPTILYCRFFPRLIFLSAVVGFISLPDLFNHVLLLMGRLLPADTMKMVYSVLGDVLASHRGTWLSFGMLGIIWTASAAFDSIIEALDICYDVNDDRPFWKTRLLCDRSRSDYRNVASVRRLAVMMVGPRFGDWLAGRLGLSSVFVAVWPALRWTLAICFTILAVEVLYFLAPNVKQRFGATLPGAVLSVFGLEWSFFFARILFSPLGQFQPDVWNVGRIHRLHDMAVLDFVCPAGGCRTECRIGQRK